MNREFWSIRSFKKGNAPEFPCPKCNQGILKLDSKKESITKTGRIASEDNYPYGIEYIISGLFICSRSECGEPVSFVGEVQKNIEMSKYNAFGEYEGEGLFNVYTIKYFYPNLKLFDLSTELSEELKEQLNISFSHFFSDLNACSNKIRTSIEILLNDISAPKYRLNKKRQRYYFKNLHDRIENIKSKNSTLYEMLSAIKIIGNEGSHSGNAELEDILDAYQILEEVIDTCFIKRKEQAVKIAKSINARKLPRSKE